MHLHLSVSRRRPHLCCTCLPPCPFPLVRTSGCTAQPMVHNSRTEQGRERERERGRHCVRAATTWGSRSKTRTSNSNRYVCRQIMYLLCGKIKYLHPPASHLTLSSHLSVPACLRSLVVSLLRHTYARTSTLSTTRTALKNQKHKNNRQSRRNALNP